MNDFEGELKEIMQLEAEMFWSLFEGLEKRIIYGEAVNAARNLCNFESVYFGTKNGDEVIDKGLRKLLSGLENEDIETWEVSLDALSADFDLLPWYGGSKLLDKFERILEIAPKGINVEKYRKLIRGYRK